MNKRQIIASLNNIANELDDTGLHIEANRLTQLMVKLSQAELPESELPEDAEAQQGGIEGVLNSVSDFFTGGPKYPGTPQQKANFMKATVDADPVNALTVKILSKVLAPVNV